MSDSKSNYDAHVEVWKMKKLIKRLSEARGNGTSMISLICQPETQVSQLSRLLTEEYGTATNIKSRVNRLSVLEAITSAQHRMKLYNKIPTNGLVLYCGTILTQEGKEKKVTIDFEPYRPINTSLYMCDNRFHVSPLMDLLDGSDVFGFIVMTGDSCLYATLQGNTKNVLYQFDVDLPKKHNKGGQSSVRFSRLREEARHNYLRKVAEIATQQFIADDKCSVKGIILAGLADFKTELYNSALFDQRLKTKVIKIVDVSYGGQSGYNQAIQLSTEIIANNRLVQEKALIQSFFTEISLDSGKYCFGVKDTLYALEQGAVETLIVHDSSQEKIDVKEEQFLFTEWIAENYQKYGAKLEFITDCSSEGSQFCKGFTGIGGLLRWKLDLDVTVDEDTYDLDTDD